MDKNSKGIVLAVLATVFFASSPLLVKLSGNGLSAGEVTFGRMFLGSLFIFCAAKMSKQPLSIPRGDLYKFALYGLVAAGHFLFYIQSLYFTTIAQSLSIIYTSPVIIAILSGIFLNEPLEKTKYLGIILVIFGIALMVGFEPYLTKEMMIGNGLAFLSAICYGIYSIVGRAERDNYSLFQYTFWVYSMSALFLLPGAIMGFTGNYEVKSIISLILLGLLPTTLGHTLYNGAVRHTHSAYVNLISTQEVTVGILLGALFLSEIPPPSTIIGVILMLGGITVVLIKKVNNGNDKKEGIYFEGVE